MDHNVVNRDLVDNRHGGGNGTALEGACFRSLDQLHDLLHVIRDRVILDWLKLVLDVADERGDQSVLVLGVLSCLYKEPFILLSCAFSVDEVGFHWAEKGVGVRRNYNLLFDPLTLPLFFREDDCENDASVYNLRKRGVCAADVIRAHESSDAKEPTDLVSEVANVHGAVFPQCLKVL